MRLDQNPIYRREIVPWYDSEIACLIVIAFMISILLFAVVGITVARENPAYHPHTWVPVLAVGLSGAVVVSTTVRMIKRYLKRLSP